MAKGRVYQASMIGDVTLEPAATSLVYQASLALPDEVAPSRARVYQAALTLPAAGDGGTARVYLAAFTLPVPVGQTPPSGIWAARDGNITPCGLRAAVNGSL